MEQDSGELAAKVLLRMHDVRGWIAGLVLILTSPVWAAGAIVFALMPTEPGNVTTDREVMP